MQSGILILKVAGKNMRYDVTARIAARAAARSADLDELARLAGARRQLASPCNDVVGKDRQ